MPPASSAGRDAHSRVDQLLTASAEDNRPLETADVPSMPFPGSSGRMRLDPRKKRGKFFTPSELAEFVVRWAVRHPSDVVLDPSCGKGVFLSVAADRLLQLGANCNAVSAQILGVDILPSHAQKSTAVVSERLGGAVPRILTEDFFVAVQSSLKSERFDAIVGNPPFIRYQRFNGSSRKAATTMMESSGFRATKLMNAWVPFVLASAKLLRPGGRLGLVLPAELLQVSHATGIRRFLVRELGFCHVIAFPQLQFEEALIDVVLLLCQKGTSPGLSLKEAQNAADLEPSNYPPQSKGVPLTEEEAGGKWLQFLLPSGQRDLLNRLIGDVRIRPLGEFACVDIGIVTGANDFFVLSKDQAVSLGVARTSARVVCRTQDLRGVKFLKSDWASNADRARPVYLFSPDSRALRRLPVTDYIHQGEKAGVHLGWKCSIRDPWYRTPSVWAPDALLFRQIWAAPRLVANLTGAVPTDTIHRVRTKIGTSLTDLVSAFHNSLTFAAAEVFGRSYGGGVLELEPTEAERLPMPMVSGSRRILTEVDGLVRKGCIDDAVQLVDEHVLHEGLRVSRKDIAELRSIRRKLSSRRLSRRSRRPKNGMRFQRSAPYPTAP